MEKGIKFSNQIYPATEEQIITQAEYIHDSEWENDLNTENNKKDQQSINKKLNDRINSSKEQLTNQITSSADTLQGNINTTKSNLLGYINRNIDGLINKVTPGLGLQQTAISQCTIGETSNEITEITDSELAVCDTLFRYGDYSTVDDSYAGSIQGYTPGDFNGDTKVDIRDVTDIIDTLLANKDSFPDSGNFSVILTPKNQNNLTIKYLGDQNSESFITSREFKIKLTDFKLKEFVIDDTTQEEQTIVETNIKSGQSLVEKKLAILDSYQKSRNTTKNRDNSIVVNGFQFEIKGYINNNEEYVSADQFMKKGTYSVVLENIDDPENMTIKLVGKQIVQKQTTGGQIEYVLEDDFDILTDIDITINDPANLLRLLIPEDGLNISQVTNLIDALLLGDSIINIFSLLGAGYFIYDNNGNPVNGCPGLIYQAIAKDGKIFRFISYGEYNRVYPFLLSEVDLTYIVDHLKNSVITENSEIGRQDFLRHNIGVSFTKLSDQDIIDADNSDGISNIFYDQGTKIVNISNINNIVKIPLYLYDIPNISVRESTVTYNNNFDGKVLSFYLQDSSKFWLVNDIGEEVDQLVFQNINNTCPFIVLKLKFNPDLNIYTYVDGHFELSEDVAISFNGKGVLQLNCNITSI